MLGNFFHLLLLHSHKLEQLLLGLIFEILVNLELARNLGEMIFECALSLLLL